MTLPSGAQLIPFAPEYAVTDCGKVYSSKYGDWRQLKPWLNRTGYAFVSLRLDGRKRATLVHRLVALVFKGPARGPEVRHIDGDPKNNHVSNLEWGTHAENMADMVRHGRSQRGVERPDVRGTNHPLNKKPWLRCRGERHGSAKLKSSDVISIRRRRVAGERGCDLAREYGVTQQAIFRIVHRMCWKHLEGGING